MLTAIPPSSLWQRMNRSPKSRVVSPTILKLNALTYQSAVFLGSGDFRWMWLMRNGIVRSQVTSWARPQPAGPRPRLAGTVGDARPVVKDQVRGARAGAGVGPSAASPTVVHTMVTACPSGRGDPVVP